MKDDKVRRGLRHRPQRFCFGQQSILPWQNNELTAAVAHLVFDPPQKGRIPGLSQHHRVLRSLIDGDPVPECPGVPANTPYHGGNMKDPTLTPSSLTGKLTPLEISRRLWHVEMIEVSPNLERDVLNPPVGEPPRVMGAGV
jgi:hypothetical protein